MTEKRRAGRKPKIDHIKVAKWRRENNASIADTARHFGVSERTVVKACAEEADARVRWRAERERREVEELDQAEQLLKIKLERLKEAEQRAERAREEGRWDFDAFIDVMDAANSLIPPDHRDKWWR